jgi:hypothetical protein
LLLLLLLLVCLMLQTANTDGFGWLDFNMPKEQKMKLFREGAIAGVNLLIE